MSDLAARVDRIESTEQIRQLASKYALALDMRDIDALVNLYVEDVRINKASSGRQALKQVFCEVVRAFTASVHHIGNHIIEFDDPDNAHGLVYCRCEHEVGEKWVPVYLYYLDLYARVAGDLAVQAACPLRIVRRRYARASNGSAQIALARARARRWRMACAFSVLGRVLGRSLARWGAAAGASCARSVSGYNAPWRAAAQATGFFVDEGLKGCRSTSASIW